MSTCPTVSVVVPARRAAATIGPTIDSILGQVYAGPLDVFVAVGPDDDDTRHALLAYGDRVTVVENPSGSTPDGLNAAIAASTGEVVVRCDAHATLPIDYVRTAVETLQRTGAANVGGIQEAVGRTAWERAVATAQSTPLGVGDARYRLGGDPGPVDTVYLGVFQRSWLENVGGYDSRFTRNQDYELNWRIRSNGGVVWFDPTLRVTYLPRSTITSLSRQYFEYGLWKRRMLALHPSSVRPRQLAAPALVAALVASAPLALVHPLLGASTPLTYGAAVVVTAIGATIRRRDAAALMTVIAIPVMHLSWGVGFLLGHSRS
jgi:succinoglycan biosynthesis protein ExoA